MCGCPGYYETIIVVRKSTKCDNIVIMDAGRGQQRVKATVGSSSSGANLKSVGTLNGVEITYSWAEWLDWLQAENIGHIKLLSYYLGNERMHRNKELLDEEKEFVLRELFIDAVDADAINFSKKVDSKDFSFKLPVSPSSLIIKYTPGGGEKFEERIAYFPFHLLMSNDALDSTYHMCYILYFLHKVARNITE